MNTDDWKELGKALITKGLPLLGTVVSGPAGVAIGSAGALIASVLGEDVVDNPVAILQALNADPGLVAELKRVEAQNLQALRGLALQQERMYLEDVQDARSREVDMTKATGKKDANLYVLAWTVVIGFLGVIVMLALIENPFTKNPAAMILLGGLATGFGSVLHYFFGSSRGSKDKTQAMALMIGDSK